MAFGVNHAQLELPSLGFHAKHQAPLDMDIATAGTIVAVTAYFFLTCLLFWVAFIPRANRSTLWWAMATGCALCARLSFMVLKPYLPPTYIEAVYAVFINLEKTFLLIGFFHFFTLHNITRFKKIVFTIFCVELLLIGITKILLNANTLFAIQFSVLNATALATIAVLIAKHLSTHSALWMRPLMLTLIIFCIHWLTYPIARHYPTWLQYGLLFGNLVNLATYLTYAMLALMAFQQRLLQAEQTALKNAEKATQSSKAKSEFLANMSHEIRTPINGVLGMLELLKKTSLSEDQQHKVAMALRSGNSLLSIINDILDFSKIEAGKITIEKQAFNIKQLLQDIAETMQHQADTKGLSVTLNTSQIHQDWVVGDESRVRQIVVNLLGNAIKFTERGAVAISASTKMDEQSVQFECEIQDTGIGISSDQAKKLFSAFNQADASTTRKYGGTGLGLVISKKLCTLMGGKLSLESELGRGSTFNFRLTFEKSHAEQQPQAPAATISEPPTAQPTCRILLVEDNEINQLVAEGMLEDYGYACEMAENGEIALTMLINASTTNPYDLILMDCQMPIMDGYACTQAIRAGKAGDKHKVIPIIAMTANAMKGDREKCIAAGMDDYLTKPLDEEVFIKMLQQWLPSLTPPQ